jgi:head-tail adaptor
MARPVVEIRDGWPVLDVGRCVHPVTIWDQRIGSPPEYDGAGPVLSWVKVADAMASIEAMLGSDVVRSGQTTAQLFVEIVLWWQSGIASDMQVRTAQGKTYVVQSAEDVLDRNVVWRLNCLGLK